MILELEVFQAIALYATPTSIDRIRTNGYYFIGDGGAGLYKRVMSIPAHGGYGISATGHIFELQLEYPTSPETYGAFGNGVADDTLALKTMGDHARIKGILNAKFLAGKTYIHKNPNFLAGIPYIKIQAYGAKIKNILGSNIPSWVEDRIALNFPLFWTNYGTGLMNNTVKDWGDLIQSADAGAGTINLVSGNARMANGNRVLIYGFDGHGASTFPPCGRVFEYGVVDTVSGGQVTLKAPLKNSYDASWPDGIGSSSSNPRYGAPRIVNLDRGAEFTQVRYLEIAGLETLANEAWTDGNGTPERNGRLSVASCDYARIVDVKVAGGIYVLAGGTYEFHNVETNPAGTIEIDKMVEKVRLVNTKTDYVSGATAANVVELEDCDLYTGVNLGAIERLTIKGGAVCKGGLGSSQAMLNFTHGTDRVEIDSVAFKANNASRTSLIVAAQKTISVKAVVSQTTDDAVLDIGTQEEYEATLFMRGVGLGYTVFDANDLPLAIIKRLPYLSGGRILLGVKSLRTITTGDTLTTPGVQNLRVSGTHASGPYGHQLTNVIAPLGRPAIEGVTKRLEFT
jgi:hypothetical protein